MTSESAGPPWMAYHPDGSIHISGVPDRLLHHPEMQRRGIRLAYALKPGVVFRAAMDGPQFVVKVVDLDTEELPISRRLHGLSSPRNHAVPCEIHDNEHPLLIMPYLAKLYNLIVWDCPSLVRLLEKFQDLAEGVDFLHQQHIAHLVQYASIALVDLIDESWQDICYGNVVAALSRHVAEHSSLIMGRTYIIDFDTSRQLALGPGSQHAITLPPTQIRPPNGLEHFDPYSWDVYCLGQVYKKLIKDFSFVRQYSPRIAHWCAQWLIGDERGCHTPCRCRPTARTVCRALSVLRAVSPIIEVCERLYDRYFLMLGGAMNPGVAFRSIPAVDPQSIVKVLDLDTERLLVYERLLRKLKWPRNHTVPCGINREGYPLLIMLYLVQLDNHVIRDCPSLGHLL